jgi:DNA repair exonuclease SbcCD ATPase subunit/DNA repair exonuclease SbcCD nuclease subunit
VKFAHIADTHIKNLKYHYEYRIVFDQLYDELRKQKVDYIVHCGDIAHTKTQISPEFVEMCSEFFRNLAAIAPTYIVLGNHDGNLKNSSRQDALTPIVEALALDDLHLLKNSGETHIDDKFCLNVLSVFDRANWIKPTDDSKINIALYHGSISNCKTDTNWTMAHGEDSISIFDDHDFAMLGDIHRRQFLDEHGRVWYAGSTVQQNHGETNDKGILIWEINSKDDWDIEPIIFKNPKPFITIELTKKGRMPKNTSIASGARLRIVSNNNLPLNVMKRAVDIAKHRFKPESISFLNRASGQRGSVEAITDGLQSENLRDIKVQEELISEYLKDYQASDEILENVYNLNKKYNTIIEKDEDISRNINWKLVNFEFDNLFNYGDDNNVSFDKLGGIVGIFGKNFSGKSSIVDGVLWTLFNTTSKNERKNLNVINQNRDDCRGKVAIQINDLVYTVERTAKKYVKRLKGEETLEAKTDLNFEVYSPITDDITSLNGLTRNNTDANIRKHFGTVEDFSVSSLASQHGSLAFIDEGSTKRKEIIAKFLDLEIFDKKFKLAKEESIEARAYLKKLEDIDYNFEIEEAEIKLENCKKKVLRHEKKIQNYKNTLQVNREKLSEIDKKISDIPAKAINIFDVYRTLEKNQKQISLLSNKIIEDANILKNEKKRFDKINTLMGQLDYNALLEKQTEIHETSARLAEFTTMIDSAVSKEKLLDGIPCGSSYPTCKFIKDAHVAVATIPEFKNEVKELESALSVLSPDLVADHIEKYKTLNTKKQETEILVKDLKMGIERNNIALERINNSVLELNDQKIAYEQNKEAIENLEKLLNDKSKYENGIKKITETIEFDKEKILELYKKVGSYEQQLDNITAQHKEFIKLQSEFTAYDLFMRCMHSNGIAYDIIKKKMPVINQEVAKVLANIVDFEIFFDSSGNKFDIFIKHPTYDERPIEMASGAEKTMAAMAIRLSLLSVSSLPKSDLFILDEPGTALDEENMEGFIRILELIKVYFKNVLLISHLDSLKDCVDMQIVIEKKDGYARVNQ